MLYARIWSDALEASPSRLSGPYAATIFGRRVPFSRGACAIWKNNRLRGPCFRIRHPSEVSSCSILLELHQHETGGTSGFRERAPSFRGSRQPELYDRFQRVRCSTGASLSVSQCRPARVVLIRAIPSVDSDHHDGLLTGQCYLNLRRCL